MNCIACGSSNAADAKFCSQCGRPLAITCESCRNVSIPGSRFCNQCGQPLNVPVVTVVPAAPPPPTASPAESENARYAAANKAKGCLVTILVAVVIIITLAIIRAYEGPPQSTGTSRPETAADRPTPAAQSSGSSPLQSSNSSTPTAQASPSSARAAKLPDALTMMETTFVGNYRRDRIKRCLDRALLLYDTAPTEENYHRAASALVTLRKSTGVPEMAILAYAIRSKVPGVRVTFPEIAGLAATMIQAGERPGSCN